MSPFVSVDPATARGKSAELLARVKAGLGIAPDMTRRRARSNGRDYCLAAHGALGKGAGLRAGDLAAIQAAGLDGGANRRNRRQRRAQRVHQRLQQRRGYPGRRSGGTAAPRGEGGVT